MQSMSPSMPSYLKACELFSEELKTSAMGYSEEDQGLIEGKTKRDVQEFLRNHGGFEHVHSIHLPFSFLTILPTQIAFFSSLRILNLTQNKLRELPKEICALPNLEMLSANYNRIGVIPKEIDRLTRLVVLNLSHNRIREIPPTLSNLGNLRMLFLQFNKITDLTPQLFPIQMVNNFTEEILSLISPIIV